MSRSRTLFFVVSASLLAITSASAQPAPQGGGVKAAQAAAKPAAPRRAVASFWTSSEPTFDEGTYDRINAAMLSYSAIEVRGGWPTVAKVNLSPGASGSIRDNIIFSLHQRQDGRVIVSE